LLITNQVRQFNTGFYQKSKTNRQCQLLRDDDYDDDDDDDNDDDDSDAADEVIIIIIISITNSDMISVSIANGDGQRKVINW